MVDRSFFLRKSANKTACVLALFLVGASPALAQPNGTEPRFRFGLGTEIRYYGVDVTVNTDYGGGRYSDTVSVNSTDPGIDAFVSFPPIGDGRGRFFAGIWAAPGASVDVEVCQSSGCSSVETRFKLNPNDVSGFLGYEHILWRAAGMQVIGRGYAGGRVSSWDLDVAGSYTRSESGTELVPAGGFDLAVEWDRPECRFDDFRWGFYGGAQIQGGYEVNTELSSATSHEVEVGEGVTGYFGVRGRFRF